MNKKQVKRSGNRMGYLYKVAQNKEYPANHSIKGLYWLQLQVNGHKKRIALKDEQGNRITDYEEAQRIKQKLIAPLLIKEQQDIASFILSSLNGLKAEEHNAIVNQNALSGIGTNVKLTDAVDNYKQISISLDDIGFKHLNRTISDSKHLIAYVQAKYPTKLYVSEITTVDVKDFIDSLGSVLPNTYNNRIGGLSRFFKLVMEKYKEENPNYVNPVSKIKLKAVTSENSHPKRVLTSDEVKRILEEAKKISNDLYLLFLIGATTGLRLGDCTTLKWSEVNLEKGLIVKIASKTKRYNVKPVVIAIVDILKEALSKIDKRKEYVLPPYKDSFDNKIVYNNITEQIATVFKNAGIVTSIPKGKQGKNPIKVVGFHSLRGTFVTRHAELGTPLAVVQASTGHSNAAMTMHYQQVSEGRVIEAAKNYKL